MLISRRRKAKLEILRDESGNEMEEMKNRGEERERERKKKKRDEMVKWKS